MKARFFKVDDQIRSSAVPLPANELNLSSVPSGDRDTATDFDSLGNSCRVNIPWYVRQRRHDIRAESSLVGDGRHLQGNHTRHEERQHAFIVTLCCLRVVVLAETRASLPVHRRVAGRGKIPMYWSLDHNWC
jgi:hypothetical protein